MPRCEVTLYILLVAWASCQAAPPISPDAADASQLLLHLPAELRVQSAAIAANNKTVAEGKTEQQAVRFIGVRPQTPLSITIVGQLDGEAAPVTLQGVDLGWYADAGPEDAGKPLAGDDREQLRSIVQDVKDFYNRKDILALAGDRQRAVALVRLVRDTDFYAGKGQIVWRTELWYFENQAGGWAAVAQQNKVLHRERFKDAAAYKAATANLRFVPALGGIRTEAGKTTTIHLTPQQIAAAPAAYGGDAAKEDPKKSKR